MTEDDWTYDPKIRRGNSSEAFERIVRAVELLLSDINLGADLNQTARLIVAQLAHVHGLAPKSK